MNQEIKSGQESSSPDIYHELKLRIAELETENAHLREEIGGGKSKKKISKENEIKNRNLFDLLPIGIFETDVDGNLIYINQQAFAQIGYSQHEFDRGIHILDTIALASRADAIENIRRVMEGKSSARGEYIFVRKDKTTFPGVVESTAITDQGKATGLRGIVIDISEQKQAEEALKESKEKMRSFLLAAPVGVGVVSDQIIVEVNDRLAEMVGYSTKELVGKNIEKIFPSDDQHDLAAQEIFRLIDETGTGTIETEFKRKDGEIIFVLLSVTPIDPADLSVGTSFIALDITDRKRTEEALEKRIMALTQPLNRAEDILFEELFNLDDIQRLQDEFGKATGVGTLITRPDGAPITKPGNFTRLCMDFIRQTPLGLKNCQISDAAIGKHDPTGPTIQPCLSAGLCNAGASITVGGKHIANWLIGQVRNENQTEEQMRCYAREIGADEEAVAKAFQEVPVMSDQQFENVAQMLFTLAGQLSATAYQNVQQARFITERRQIEEEKEKLQTQLRHAEKMEAIGTLAGGIAHDFNNLLQVIIGAAQFILLDADTASDNNARLNEILSACERAKALIRQLLLFSRKLESEKKAINLNQRIEQSVIMLERTLPKMIDTQLRLAGDLWPVSADPIQMEQILFNLGSNAADSMPNGGKLIFETENVFLDHEFINTHLEATPGNYVQISVSDTGCGMDKETVAHAFEPFFTTKEIGKGTGLGLASAYGIVKNHGGFMTCYSEIGRGSVFRIYLPAIEKAKTGASSEEEGNAATEPFQGGTETLLLVDDDKSIRDLTSELLKRFGYKVLTAASGEEALGIFAGGIGEIDLVILDISMPGMGGHKCFQEMIDLDPSAKILLASGYSINGQVRKTLEAGALGYIGKPYRLADLLSQIRSSFNR